MTALNTEGKSNCKALPEDSGHATMWHVHASTRASVWAAIAGLVVLPVFTTHTTHLRMPTCAARTEACHLLIASFSAEVVTILAVEWASAPWAAVSLAKALAA